MGIELSKDKISQIQKILGYKMKNSQYLQEAFTHTSVANVMGVKSYERLEFLGDSVLSLIISDYIFRNFEISEGELTKFRAAVVCETSLAETVTGLGLDKFIIYHNNDGIGLCDRPSIIGDVFESILGAIYLDGGMKAATKFVLKKLGNVIDLASRGEIRRDYKTTLQEAVQARGGKVEYITLHESGVPHKMNFEVEVRVNGAKRAVGKGRTKKGAQQEAARVALQGMKKGNS